MGTRTLLRHVEALAAELFGAAILPGSLLREGLEARCVAVGASLTEPE